MAMWLRKWWLAGDPHAARGLQAMAAAASRSQLSGARTMRRTAARALQRGTASRCLAHALSNYFIVS